MTGALLYLHFTSLKNAVLVKLRRLKQPRYLIGFIVGLLYFYWFIFRHMFSAVTIKQAGRHGHHAGVGVDFFGNGANWTQFFEPFAACVLLIIFALAWIIPRSRDVLRFTEAEVSFLFTAPIPRSTLIHYKLLKSQLGILFTAVILGFFSMRAQFIGGSAWVHILSYWIILSTLNLHLIASSFTHERLLNMGMNPWLRRGLAVLLLIALGAGAFVWMKHSMPAGINAAYGDIPSYIQAFLNAPPLGWVLQPFLLLVRPFFAKTGVEFLLNVGPALLILAAHYYWVLRSQVSFEEAAMSYAQKRAERIEAARNGRIKSLPKKARKEPFKLPPQGRQYVAFLWRGLITAGPLTYPRTWLSIAAVTAAGCHFLAKDPTLKPFQIVVTSLCAGASVWLLAFGPMVTRRGIPQMLERLDIVKTFPLRGWQVVLGELMTPLFILTAIEWLLLLAIALLGAPSEDMPEFAKLLFGPGVIGIAILAPPLLGLMVSISFGAALLFPAWMGSMGTGRSGGVEVFGQRIIFAFGYLATFLVSLLPAVLLSALPYFLIYTFTDSHLGAIIGSAISGTLILSAELAGVIWWLGDRYERIDLSVELPR